MVDETVKLHLGCGDQYLEEWVNVDKYDYERKDSASRLDDEDIPLPYILQIMPDLRKVATLYVANGRKGWKTISTPVGRLSKAFTQFYGNQWDKLEYEVHRYLWDRDEFCEEVEKAGFKVNHQDAHPQYHVGNRDMRVVATKWQVQR